MKRSLTLILLFSLTVLAASCHHPDDPPPPSGPEPGKRDYTWTIDTLSYPGSFQTLMYGIWASSPKDVYVVGHNDQGSKGIMYHYDGVRWTDVKLHISQGGSINKLFDLAKVFGIGSNNVRAVGIELWVNPAPPPNFLDSSIIIHFDGTAWREESILKGRQMLGIGGASANDLWAAGAKGTLYHGDGTSWSKRDDVDSSRFYSQIVAYSPSNVYMTSGKSLYGPDTIGGYQYYLHHWDGERWVIIDSSSTNEASPKFTAVLWGASTDHLYSSYLGVTRSDHGAEGWQYVLNTNMPVTIAGSSDQNIFAIGDRWHIYHWNGSDWQSIANPFSGPGDFTAAWTDNHETFIVANDGRRTYIMHGK